MIWLRGVLAVASGVGETEGEGRLYGPEGSLTYQDLALRTGLGQALGALAGRSVLVRTRGQMGAAQALVELDGLVRRLVLCPPDLDPDHLPLILEQAGVEAIVTDDDAVGHPFLPVYRLGPPTMLVSPAAHLPYSARKSEWLMFTSGTTGAPKMVIHTLAGLTGAIRRRSPSDPTTVWGTFYDIRRYGGLQILLRGLTGGCSMVLSEAGEAMSAHLERLAAAGVTHQSGTPSHWRRALMTPELRRIDPAYVRLSGEIADQAVLDRLKAFFPRAGVSHAYASTEAGVGFEVDDGLEGFPASLIGGDGPVAMRVVDGSLRIRSGRTASGYAGHDAVLVDAQGFVDTGDMVERRGERYYFTGRRGGIINVGGMKVHPEEIEAVINRHPAVRLCRVGARRSPISGALVVAEVVRTEQAKGIQEAALKAGLLAFCREHLAPYKVPTSLTFVDSLALSASGKLERRYA